MRNVVRMTAYMYEMQWQVPRDIFEDVMSGLGRRNLTGQPCASWLSHAARVHLAPYWLLAPVPRMNVLEKTNRTTRWPAIGSDTRQQGYLDCQVKVEPFLQCTTGHGWGGCHAHLSLHPFLLQNIAASAAENQTNYGRNGHDKSS